MKPLNQMTDAELIQYAAWQCERWERILHHLHCVAPALTTQERTARKQAALAANNETFDEYLASLPKEESRPLPAELEAAAAVRGS